MWCEHGENLFVYICHLGEIGWFELHAGFVSFAMMSPTIGPHSYALLSHCTSLPTSF